MSQVINAAASPPSSGGIFEKNIVGAEEHHDGRGEPIV